ncbi:hypothetical protein [Marinococcus halotolerans]|uniref:hypothetical protein n=1 Tax=Marinococcus halotolerans TaxID=301092 RepID=UPI0003B43941|nr:hypothetical protein [Marinococcus halotolerans]
MPYTAFIQRPQEWEVATGTLLDLQQQGWTSFDAIFATIEELFTSLQVFREQEWIITCISDLPELQERWQEKWAGTSSVPIMAMPIRKEKQI